MTPYEHELSHLAATIDSATAADITGLKGALAAASDASVIAVGSGGSFTVASLLCSLHEAYTGRVSRAVTPLELISNPTLAATSPIFIISAEGKNPDVLEALQRARKHSSRSVHVLTNRAESPLMSRANELHDVTTHVFELAKKDGYLATNSLVLDATLVTRAFEELDGRFSTPIPPDQIVISGESLASWLEKSRPFAREVARRCGLIVIYSPRLRPLAEDLESKLSEAALTFSQFADFRSFAHGRHLWLTDRAADTALLILTEPGTAQLWNDMQPQVPADVPVFDLALAGATPNDLLQGLIGVMHLVSAVGDAAARNIAKPAISPLGRQLYYADLPSLIPAHEETSPRGEPSKYEVLGANWPARRQNGKIRRALEATQSAFRDRSFSAIVFDYDGTLCSSSARDVAPSTAIIEHLTRLTTSGVIVGIASGRGGSIGEFLEEKLDRSLWDKVRLGLYNGGWIGRLGEQPAKAERPSEFLIHAERIIANLQSYGVPITSVRATPPHQLSVRFDNGVSTESMWFVIVDAFKQAGLESGTILRSKHSIDILSRGVSKSHLVARIVQDEALDPYSVITMGDLGAWPGNDSSLLQHQFSLSVDLPSRRLDRGWKLAPHFKRDVDATLWYLDRLRTVRRGRFVLDLEGDV